jgi:hypothetical protein
MVRHGYLTDLHVFLLAFKGKVQRLGWFHADIWEAWAFWTEHMTSVTVVKSPSFALPASKLSSIYRNLKSNDSDLLYNLPPCSLAASNPFFLGLPVLLPRLISKPSGAWDLWSFCAKA